MRSLRHILTLLILLVALPMPSLAQEPALKKAIASALPGHQIYDLKSSGRWALCSWSQGEGGGMALFHKHGQGWELAQSGGGAMGLAEIAQLGVPAADRAKLMPKVEAAERQRAKEAVREPYWTWLTRKKALSAMDLDQYTGWELSLMRNEIFALYGRPFSDPELQAYFSERPWYRKNPNYSDAKLSKLERANVDFISSYQKKTGKQ